MVITSIAQLRKIIKPLGYSVRVKSFSFGQAATFYKGKEACPSIFSSRTISEWKPLFDCLRAYTIEIEEVYGLKII